MGGWATKSNNIICVSPQKFLCHFFRRVINGDNNRWYHFQTYKKYPCPCCVWTYYDMKLINAVKLSLFVDAYALWYWCLFVQSWSHMIYTSLSWCGDHFGMIPVRQISLLWLYNMREIMDEWTCTLASNFWCVDSKVSCIISMLHARKHFLQVIE